MALTNMLRNNCEMKDLIRRTMPSKQYFSSNTSLKAFSTKNVRLAPYILENPKQARLVGTATDYLFRFLVGRTIKTNKDACYTNLAAEIGLEAIRQKDKKLYEKIADRYDKYIQDIKDFVYGKKENENIIIRATLFLSRLEGIYRGGVTKGSLEVLVEKPSDSLIQDIKNVAEVFKDTFILSGLVNTDSDVVFNPRFGLWGDKCFGADADIYIDGILYDFKCTKDIGYNWDDVGQVYAYYLLNLLCQKDKCKEASLFDKEIKGIAIYYSRFGSINQCILAESDADFSNSVLLSLKELLNKAGENGIKELSEVVNKKGLNDKWGNSANKVLSRKLENKKDDLLDLKVGDRVEHVKFGGGVILEVVKSKKACEIVIKFDMYGKKRISASANHLRKIV